jgi:hypothetical protein
MMTSAASKVMISSIDSVMDCCINCCPFTERYQENCIHLSVNQEYSNDDAA